MSTRWPFRNIRRAAMNAAAGVAFVRVGSAFSEAARKASDSLAGGPSSSMGLGTALMDPSIAGAIDTSGMCSGARHFQILCLGSLDAGRDRLVNRRVGEVGHARNPATGAWCLFARSGGKRTIGDLLRVALGRSNPLPNSAVPRCGLAVI